MPLTIRNMEIFQTGVPQRTPLMTFNSEPEHHISMVANFTAGEPVSYTHLTLPTTPYV